MNRRRLLRFAIVAAASARATQLWAQTAVVGPRRVGVLAPSSRANEAVILKPFFDEMRLLGWIQGRTVAYDGVYADDRHQDLPRLAGELVARKPELIFASSQVAAVAARRATGAIPIVFGTGTDPVGAGLVASLAHPGGNATGVVNVVDSLAPKRVELLRQILPGARRIGLLGDPTDPRLQRDADALAPVATALGLTIVVAEASNPAEFDAAVAMLIGQRVDAIFAATSITNSLRGRLIELTSRKRVPVVGGIAPMAEAGGLFSYGASLAVLFRRSAQLVDKVLKGAQPADLAVEQPTKFELVINVKAAKALGVAIPQSLLLRADEVIQ